MRPDYIDTVMAPAEAATEVGADQPTPADRQWMRRVFGALVVFWVAVGCVWSLL